MQPMQKALWRRPFFSRKPIGFNILGLGLGLGLALIASSRAEGLDLQKKLGKCLGDSIPLKVENQSPYVQLTAGSPKKENQGWFLIDTGASESYLDLEQWRGTVDCDKTHKICHPSVFKFFDLFKKSYFYIQDYSRVSPGLKQAGLLGTDFLDGYPYTFDYDHQLFYRAQPEQFCTDFELSQAGLFSVSTAGYFTQDRKTLRKLDGKLLPNIPTVSVELAGVAASAQIDTGYNDLKWPLSVNMNGAMKKALEDAHVELTPVPSRNSKVTTCIPGIRDELIAYDIPSSALLTIKSGIHFTKIHLFLKQHMDSKTRVCGGISTWSTPAVQLGASFIKKAGVMILDAKAEKVWFPILKD